MLSLKCTSAHTGTTPFDMPRYVSAYVSDKHSIAVTTAAAKATTKAEEHSYYNADYSYYEDECAEFGKSNCETQTKVECAWRNDKCQQKVPNHSFKFPGYTVATFKRCAHRSHYFAGKPNQFKNAKDCVKKCSFDPKCVSAEWYRVRPNMCYLSSVCTLDNALPAGRVHREQVFLFVKDKNFTKPQNVTMPKDGAGIMITLADKM